MDLAVNDLHVHYNNVAALKGISLHVKSGEFVTLIGSNGAGKSTALRAISGLVSASSGTIELDGKRIEKIPADQILKLGVAQVPEGRRIFKDMTVLENLRLGAFARNDKAEVEKDLEWNFEVFPRLRERRHQHARTLSGGEQQMVSISRALMSRPQVLLLDEPSLGLAPIVVKEIGEVLLDINKRGVTIILVEQNADLALKLANHGYVLETGKISLSDRSELLADNEHVKRAYLGI